MNQAKTVQLVVGLTLVVLLASFGLRLATRHQQPPRPLAADPRKEIILPPPPRVESALPAAPDSPPTPDVAPAPSGLELPAEKVAEYLQRHERDAASLLAAYHAMQDTNLLREAAARFPTNAYVQWAMLMTENLAPAERRKWLDAFKLSSPDNSLADYLSAAEYFQSGDRAAALREISAASGKARFKDFTLETMINEQELRRASGQDAMLAIHGMGWASDLMQQMAPLKQLATGIAEAREQFHQAGDTAAADDLALMGLTLAGRLNSGEGNKFLMSEMVGDAIEIKMLRTLEPETKYDALGGKTPTARLEEIKKSRAAFRELATVLPKAYGVLNESEWVTYSDRVKTFGERAALLWLQQRIQSSEAK